MKRFLRNAALCALAAGMACGASSAASRFTQRSPGHLSVLPGQRADMPRPTVQEAGGIMQLKQARKAVTAPGAMPAPAKAGEAVPSLEGLVIYSTAWNGSNATGFYRINASTGATELICTTPALGGDGTVAGVVLDNVFYATRIKDFYGQVSSLTYYTVDLATGRTTSTEAENPTYDGASANMTYDASTSTVYSINYDGSPNYYSLCRFNHKDFTFEKVGDLQNHYYAICSDSNGHLYGIGDSGEVVEIDPATAIETRVVAQTGIEPAYQQSCAWSPRDSKIYWAACNANTAALVTVDPASGEVATATRFAGEEEVVALTCTDPAQNPGAPAAATELEVTYSEPGGTVAHISCKAPVVTVGGSALTRAMELTLYIDGEAVNELEVMPGEAYNFVQPLTEGVHEVRAVCANSFGQGTPARTMTFAGTDTPMAVGDLRAEATSATEIRVTWSAPATGENGGWFDPSKLSYNLLRNGQSIARGLTATDYSDVTDGYFVTNTYTVEVCYAGAPVSQSNSAFASAGTHLRLPYSNSFEAEQDFSLLAVIDCNGDGNTWFYDGEYNTASYNYSRTSGGNDLLVMPMIQAEAGHRYSITFFARSASASYPDKFEVLCGRSADKAGLSEVLISAKVASNAGEVLTATFDCTEAGPLYFAFHCVSDPDMSRLFIDDIQIADDGAVDAPAAVSGLVAVADPSGDLKATISFKAPETTLAGDPLAAIGRIELRRDGELIHTFNSPAPGEQLSYTDAAPAPGFNTYTAETFDPLGRGGNSSSARVFAGMYTLPFAVAPTELEYSLFTIPGGETDTSWYFDPSEQAIKVITYYNKASNAYIYTPAVSLPGDNLINLSFDCRGGLPQCTEIIEVTVGRTPNPSTHRVIGRVEIARAEYATESFTFTPPAGAGRYYIGFHCVSEPGQMMALVRNIRLERGASMEAPDYPASVEVKGDAQGALTAEVSFTLPRTTLSGNALAGSLGARIYRADGTMAAELEGLEPGQRVTLSDTGASNGFNTYSAVAFNASGEGGRSDGTGWIGVDVPSHIDRLDITPSADNLSAELEWTPPTSTLHGGYMNPRDLTYKIYQLVNNSLYLLQTTKYCQATVIPEGSNVQDFFMFYVTASTDAGESQAVNNGAVIGPPYELPVMETASNKVVTCLPWISGALEGDVNWGVADYIGSLDLAAADGGMFVCSAALPERRPGVARMQLPKVTFNGLNAPTLSFSMYHYAGSGATLHVQVTSDEVEYTTVFTASTSGKAEGWQRYSVNLADWADKPWVAIVFDGELANGASYVIVDDIEVANRSERDLMVNRVSGRTSVEAGARHTFNVEVRNAGSMALDFDLEMRVDGQLQASASSEKALAGGASVIMPLELDALPEHIGRPLEVQIEVVPRDAADEIPANNRASFNLNVHQPALPVVTDLAAVQSEEGVTLTWSTPSLTPDAIVDDFCGYESFAYENIGEFTTVDRDGLIPCGISGVEFPNMGTPMAFQVWEPKAEGVDVDAEIWQPRSGNKCLIAWTALSSYVEPFNDDWLISPALYAVADDAQTISFYTRRPVGTYGVETYEIWYSMDDSTDPDDFTLLRQERVDNGEWNFRSYELPAGARRFAIRYTSRNKFALLFDDLTYIPASDNGELVVEGFSVLRNGVEIGTTSASEHSFTDNTAVPAGARYNVAVAYNKGKSTLSNTATLTSGIDAPAAAGISISGHEGYILVEAPQGTAVTVVAADGRTVYTGTATSAPDRIMAAPGVYAVTAGRTTAKVVVR